MKTSVGFLFLLFCNMGFAVGSCLSYGHSCWGAHGKRSSSSKTEEPQLLLSNRWALLKLAKNDDIKPFKSNMKNTMFSQINNDHNNQPLFNMDSFLTNSDEYESGNGLYNSASGAGAVDENEKTKNTLQKETYNFQPNNNKHVHRSEIGDNSNTASNSQNNDDVLDLRNVRLYKMMNPNLQRFFS